MSGKEFSPEDHVVRYVKPSSMHEGRVDSSEFQLNPRRIGGKGVSVNLLDQLNLKRDKSAFGD